VFGCAEMFRFLRVNQTVQHERTQRKERPTLNHIVIGLLIAVLIHFGANFQRRRSCDLATAPDGVAYRSQNGEGQVPSFRLMKTLGPAGAIAR